MTNHPTKYESYQTNDLRENRQTKKLDAPILSYVGHKKQFTGTNNFSGLFFKTVLGYPFKLEYMIMVIGV